MIPYFTAKKGHYFINSNKILCISFTTDTHWTKDNISQDRAIHAIYEQSGETINNGQLALIN